MQGCVSIFGLSVDHTGVRALIQDACVLLMSQPRRELRFTLGEHTIDDPQLLPPPFARGEQPGHSCGSSHGTIDAQPRCSLNTRRLRPPPVLR